MEHKAKHGNFVLPLIMIIILLLLSGGLFFGLPYLKNGQTEAKPEFQYISLSEEAAARAYIWLSQIEDMPFSYAEIKEMMGSIDLRLLLMPTGEENSYTRTLVDGTFTECSEKANAGMERIYREVVRYRFLAAGYEGELSDGLLDDMMRETYGVSVSEYLALCDIQLLPTLEEVTKMYTGEVAGTAPERQSDGRQQNEKD